MTQEEIVVGLDIGTTKVGTVIASGEANAQGTGALSIIGIGVVPSRGIKRGVVVDVEETIAAIRDSVERASHMAGVKVEGAVAGITGDHIDSSNRRGTVTVASGTGAISRYDVERALQAAVLEIPRDREIIHSLPRDFSVDGHAGVKRPIGMAGQRLEVETHIVTGQASFLQNAVKCVQKAGLNVEALVLEPIATAEAVTTSDEREMGVILIDIGGGTSDLAVFADGSIIYTGVLPVGGNHVTRDIAIGLRTPFELAEHLKIQSGAATRDMIPHGEALEVMMAGSGERLRIPRSLLGEIIEARMSELFELSREKMHNAGIRRRLPGGVILAGGGALLPGAVDLASEIFQMPVRLGVPRDITGWSEQVTTPQFATGVGLCRFALRQRYAPGNQTEIPAIASSEGRRIWGAVAPMPSGPPSVGVQPAAPPPLAPSTATGGVADVSQLGTRPQTRPESTPTPPSREITELRESLTREASPEATPRPNTSTGAVNGQSSPVAPVTGSPSTVAPATAPGIGSPAPGSSVTGASVVGASASATTPLAKTPVTAPTPLQSAGTNKNERTPWDAELEKTVPSRNADSELPVAPPRPTTQTAISSATKSAGARPDETKDAGDATRRGELRGEIFRREELLANNDDEQGGWQRFWQRFKAFLGF